MAPRRLRNVFKLDGLRIHTCPKIATASIRKVFEKVPYESATQLEPGPELRFMVVRHPLDRIVSAWAFFCNTDDSNRLHPNLKALGYAMRMPFHEFLEICLQHYQEDHHTQKQIDHAGPHDIDFPCPLHRIHEGWAVLMEMCPVLIPLEHLHKSERKNWESYYDPDQRIRAEQEFSEDLALYQRALVMSEKIIHKT